ncbi:unnamed protein product [Diabrotica balteata]|uniref:DUF7041 domain-containing protein n=1 Tax=Diabrotica balteata TaxID=107213 RepID=A0A9N9SSD9_DIABA|nr:unnamed protein product [Diabrotica balteata]
MVPAKTAYISEVRDILLSPPATDRYVKLRSELIKRLSTSQQQKIKRLLEHEELGNRAMGNLQSLASTTVPDKRFLWLGRRPSFTQPILATESHADLDTVAELADTIFEAVPPRTQISQTVTALERTIGKLTADLAELKIQLANIATAKPQTNTYCRNRSTSRGRPYHRNRSHSREHNSDICWYHYRFGNSAQKCTLPCKHQENNTGNRN